MPQLRALNHRARTTHTPPINQCNVHPHPHPIPVYPRNSGTILLRRSPSKPHRAPPKSLPSLKTQSIYLPCPPCFTHHRRTRNALVFSTSTHALLNSPSAPICLRIASKMRLRPSPFTHIINGNPCFSRYMLSKIFNSRCVAAGMWSKSSGWCFVFDTSDNLQRDSCGTDSSIDRFLKRRQGTED